jgi:hypothetical protein
MKFISVVNKGRTRVLARFIVTTSYVEENEVFARLIQDPNRSTKEHESINTIE